MTPVFAPDACRDQIWLITGGGTGIGRAVAEQVHALGGSVALCGRREEPLRDTAGALGDRVIWGTCDVREPDQVDAFVDRVVAELGGLHVLVNNAGGQYPSPAAAISPKGFAAVIRNNLLGTWHFTHAAATRAMITARGGRIVNIIAQVQRGFPGMAHTGAARAGVENLTRSLAVEWVHHGVRVNAVAPGLIRTSGTDQYGDALLEAGRRATPLKRLGTAEEVASLVVYLGLPVADFITGATFTIDGGLALWGDMWEVPEPS